MPTSVFGIYGFTFFRDITVGDILLRPLCDSTEAKKKAGDENLFHLTGYGVMEKAILPDDIQSMQKLARLEDVLSFCEQRWVLASGNIRVLINEPNLQEAVSKFPPIIEMHQGRPTGGPFIPDQDLAPSAREELITLCMQKLEDDTFNDRTEFGKAFYRQIETLRLRKPYVEILYYLVFSALEILARKHCNDYAQKNAAVLITPFLTAHGFQPLTQQEVEEWAALRNAVFHEGRFEKVINRNGTLVDLTEQDFQQTHSLLQRLLRDVLLRVMQYDHPNICWYRWRDRMPFK